ncbi:MAG: ABC transporter ATP-binding protein [Verrucomicrobiota bacterium]
MRIFRKNEHGPNSSVGHSLESDELIRCEKVGVCYRTPFKLGKNFANEKEFWALRNLDLSLKKGETLGVLGRNGAGKSTLLRLLAGVISPDEGSLNKTPDLNVQLLTVSLGFERILTGRENAVMAGMLLGHTAKFMHSKLDEIKAFSELGDFFEQPVYTYSSGMVARLGFSIALQAKPDVLLLDEVLAVGDRDFKAKSREATRSLINSGKSVVLVIHDRKVIDEFCDSVINLQSHGQAL